LCEDAAANGNRAPNGPVVAVVPDAPTAGDPLECAVTSEAVDPDGDTVTYRFAWTRDGEDTHIASAQVPAGTTAAMETWTCYATPNDGALDGVTATDSVSVVAAGVGPVDIVLVVDNSGSMAEESFALVQSLDTLEYQLETAGIVDWRIGITTTSVIYNGGPTMGVDPGEAGLLIGAMTQNMEDAQQAITCDVTCWNGALLPRDATHTCGDPLQGRVTVEYLDCMCGVDEWRGHCGAGLEQGLEAAFLALCRGVETPPEECFTFPNNAAVAFSRGDEGSNAGMRSDGTTIFLIVSDEGDGSPRMSNSTQGAPLSEVNDVATAYTALLGSFRTTTRVGVFGPPWDGVNGDCMLGATPAGVERYQLVASSTGGFYEPLTEVSDGCTMRDFDTLMNAVATAIMQ
jgi:hypothetical protein